MFEVGQGISTRALPYTGGLVTPWQRHQAPSLPLYLTLRVFSWVERGYDFQIITARSARTPACWFEDSEVTFGGVFSRNPCSYVVLAQWGVQGSVRKVGRWLPHAGDLLPHGPHPSFLITSPKLSPTTPIVCLDCVYWHVGDRLPGGID